MDKTAIAMGILINADNIYKAAWLGTAAAIANPRTRALGLRSASYLTRVAVNASIGAMKGAAGTPLVRKGPTPGQMARGAGKKAVTATGAIAAGYVIGATVGTGIAYAGWGKEGASDAIDLYTGQVSAEKYFTTVGNALSKTF